MKIEKSELAGKIDRMKNVVPKSAASTALLGILVQDGYLTASNMEITVKAKLEGTEGEHMIIPARAFDLIRNLPEGELSITEGKNDRIRISMGQIRNVYPSYPADAFPLASDAASEGGGTTSIPGPALQAAMSRVLYAVPAKGNSRTMASLYMQAEDGKLNFTGLDGHMVAWVQMQFAGNEEFELLIPREAVERLLALGLNGDVRIDYNRYSAVFQTDEYEVRTRLTEGKFFSYRNLFQNYEDEVEVNRTELLNAVIRARLCTENKVPVRFEIDGGQVQISIRDETADYAETIHLQKEAARKLTMGFDARLVLETLKAHSGENIKLRLTGSTQPMIIVSPELVSLILPVKIRDKVPAAENREAEA